MVNTQHLDSLNAEQLRALARALIDQAASRKELLAGKDRELKYRQAKIYQLTHEMAVLKRWKFGRSGERLDPPQLSLLDEIIEDIAAIEVELQSLAPTTRAVTEAGKPRRARTAPGGITHEPESTVCTTPGCGCTLKRIQSKFLSAPPEREHRAGSKA